MTKSSSKDRKVDGDGIRRAQANSGCGGISPRDLVQSSVSTGIAAGVDDQTRAAQIRTDEMIYRTLGRTGEKVSAIGLGGFHIGVPKDEQEGIRIVRSAVDR